MTQLKSKKATDWTAKMALLYQSFKQHGDDQNADKLRAWYKKLTIDKNVMLAFCGHFSAGKSSLLNKIMRSQLLPSSPIPTSGNLVRIKGGAPSMQLETRAGETVVLPEHYPMEKLHDLLKDSDYIRRIDLQVGGSFPQGVELFDTPGVDSTDERHHQSTNEALHLADAVFYVTDYNHVLSDVNFNFLKTLAKLGKPFYLIVNQIDKHNEKEGSFASFKAHVESALSDWQLYPQKIFYLSLVSENVPNNDFQTFLAFLDEMMEGKAADHEDLLQGLQALAEQHRTFLKNQFEQSLKEKRIDSAPDDETLRHLDEERKALQAEIASLDGLKQSWLRQTSEDIVKAIQSAILMPFDVREAAKSYVASLDPHFKIGFFASKRKTEEERKRRLDVYLEKFQKQVQTMEWAVKDTIVRASRQAKVISESDLGSLYELSVDGLQKITTEPLSANIDTNGAYMLHYTDDVADKTKRKMRTQAMDIIGGLENLLCERSDEKAAPLRKQFAEENERYQTLQAIMVEKLALESAYKQLDDIFAGKQPVSGAAEAVQSLAKEIEEKESSKQVLTIDEYRQKYLLPKAREQEESLEKERVQDSRPKKKKTPKSDKPAEADWDQQLSQAAEILRPIDGFQDAADYLVQTAERVKHKTFTIALFGAFSAGKSSFANALLGEAILPVSPNPTTAVINHIRQSTAEHPNRSTVVHMKSEQTLLDEINQSLALFDKQIAVLSELKPLLPQLESKRSDTKGHQHVSLLHTLAHAIEHFENEWGATLEMSLAESHKMVANEKIACLIESVTMYYDCPFTKQGNVLVDTPGASSIHARHTEVAFHYIKNADAILFLTYFNHAFSRSDREFLIQLGRVKDTFSLDKMFFVINAIDLAQTEQERKDVTAYVKAQLLTFGIRHPKLFGVSSKQALLERQNGGTLSDASGMGPFIHEWNEYAEQELLMQVAQSGLKTIRQSEQQMQRWLDDLQLEGDAKENRIQALTRLKKEIGQDLKELPIEKRAPEIDQHIDEWFFYIKKRLVQRYIDEFSQFFNPALFFEQTRSNKEILYQGLKDCMEFLSFDLDQECRAAFLRVEALLKKELSRLFEKCESITAELSGSAGIAAGEPAFGHPALPEHLKDIDLKPLTAAFKFYKNPKQFFEKDGKKLMRDDLQERLEPYLTDLIEKNSECTKSHYLPLFYSESGRLTEAFKKQADQAADYTIKMLQADHQPMIAQLENARQDLTDLLAD